MRGPPSGMRRTLMLLAIAASLAACDTMWNTPGPGSQHAPIAAFPPPGALGRAHPDSIVVKPGQTLFDVARLYDIPTRAVIDANHLEPPYGLIAGQTLALPQIRTHLVRGGDTIYSVARSYGVEASTLVATNHLQSPYTIFSGTVLVLPPQAASSGGYSASIVATPLPPPSQTAAQPTMPPASVARPSPPSGSRPPTQPSSTSSVGITATPLAAPPAAAPPTPSPGPSTSPAPMAAAAQPPPVSPAPPVASPPAPAAAVSPPLAPPADQTASLSLPPPRSGRSFLWPVAGKVVGRFGPTTGGTQNDGINISAAEGTPVLAADAGMVAYAGNELRGYGNLILIKHADGWMTAYAHNSKLLVARGQKVQRGQVIARVGATGAVTEPQLHFEVRRGSRALDPMDYLGPQAVSG